jgi:hypothetical protein
MDGEIAHNYDKRRREEEREEKKKGKRKKNTRKETYMLLLRHGEGGPRGERGEIKGAQPPPHLALDSFVVDRLTNVSTLGRPNEDLKGLVLDPFGQGCTHKVSTGQSGCLLLQGEIVLGNEFRIDGKP